MNEALFDARERKMAARLERRPVCKFCHEHIQDETAYNIPNIGIVCKECLDECEFYIEEE